MVHRSEILSHAFTFRWMGLTRPQRGFTHVRPSGLSLACGSGESEPLDITAPASHPAVTSDALGVGNRLEHWPEAVRPAHSLDATSCRTSKNPHALRQGNVAAWWKLREKLEARHEGRRAARHFRRDSATHLAKLEEALHPRWVLL